MAGSPAHDIKKLEDEFADLIKHGKPVRPVEQDILACIRAAQKLEKELRKIEQATVRPLL